MRATLAIATIFLCSRFAIGHVRDREDWWAALNVFAVLLNLAYLIDH